MNALQLCARLYIECSLLLGVGCAILIPGSRWFFSVRWLSTARVLLGMSLGMPFAMALVPQTAYLPPKAQIWAETAHEKTAPTFATTLQTVAASVDRLPRLSLQDSGWRALGLLVIALAIGGLINFSRRYFQLGAFLRRQNPVRKLGKVIVLASDETSVAFSAHHGGRAYIALPTAVWQHPAEARMTLAHEAQHHRQRDTLLTLRLEMLRALLWGNPLLSLFSRHVRELQEFACDEALIGRRFSSQAYGRCLLRAAQTAVDSRRFLVGTTGMAASSSGQFLKRRIQMILTPVPKGTVFHGRVFHIGTVLLLVVISWTAHAGLSNRRLTMEQARRAAEKAALGSQIPIDMNELVLDAMNRYVATDEGRSRLKQAFGRMPKYQAMIEKKLSEAGLPPELIAIPLHESGFRNDAISSAKSAGIWQFIPETARRYKLVAFDKREEMVPGKDERFDEEKETDAAVQYLRDLFTEFRDWRLAIKAYNEGEVRVARLKKEAGSRDPWVLERKSSTESYLSGAIATLILNQNRDLLD